MSDKYIKITFQPLQYFPINKFTYLSCWKKYKLLYKKLSIYLYNNFMKNYLHINKFSLLHIKQQNIINYLFLCNNNWRIISKIYYFRILTEHIQVKKRIRIFKKPLYFLCHIYNTYYNIVTLIKYLHPFSDFVFLKLNVKFLAKKILITLKINKSCIAWPTISFFFRLPFIFFLPATHICDILLQVSHLFILLYKTIYFFPLTTGCIVSSYHQACNI